MNLKGAVFLHTFSNVSPPAQPAPSTLPLARGREWCKLLSLTAAGRHESEPGGVMETLIEGFGAPQQDNVLSRLALLREEQAKLRQVRLEF